MAKASGSTRGSASAASNTVTPEQTLRPAMQDSIAQLINKGGYTEFSREQAEAWEDMTLDEKLATLQQGGFTGLVDADELDNIGTLYLPIDKQQLVNEFQEALANEMGFNGMDDSITFTVGYKDGTRKYLSYMENDFDDAGITRATASRASWAKAKSALHLRDVAYIIRSDGYAEPNYWVAKDAASQQLLKDYGGFQQWERGRVTQ